MGLSARQCALIVALTAVVSACAQAAGTPTLAPVELPSATAAELPASASPTTAPTRRPTATRAPTATLEAGKYRNPVMDADFPDPDVLQVDGVYYAYATNTDGRNIQVARSSDLANWELVGDALPDLPDWAVQDFGYAWAPEVTASTDGDTYLMYFTARNASADSQCIGLATAEQPEGPFDAEDDAPLICQIGQGGSIDAAFFTDNDGARYLLWKNDGNSDGGQSFIQIQRLSADDRGLEGEPTRLVSADQAWEGILVEGPTLWKRNGRYFLFYSANDYSSPRYAVGYAVADEPMGPYTKAEEPLLETQMLAGVVGPGGQDVVLGPDGETWLLFHGWMPGGYRSLHLAQLQWIDDQPVVGELSRLPLDAP